MANYMDHHINEIDEHMGKNIQPGERLEICTGALTNLIHTIEPWRAHLVASMLAMKLLDVTMKNLVASSLLDALMRGLEGNVTTQMDLAVGDLGDAGRGSAELSACLLEPDTDYKIKLKKAKKLPAGKEFVAEWDEFIKKYGARGPSEIDLSRPRWREDANSLMSMVVGIIKSGERGAHREHYEKLIAENHLAKTAIIDAAGGGFWGFVRKRFVKRMVYVICALFPLREHHKFLLIRLFDLCKPAIEQCGHQMQIEGLIGEVDDVWFFDLGELKKCMGDKISIGAEEIARRKRDFEHYSKLTPPRVMSGEGEVYSAFYDNSHAPEGALIGSPVSAGCVEGLANVVMDPSKQTLHAGEILVAPFTDPGWTPLFVNAAGLVTEVGGLMTHGSVIAREYGIPAVVGVIDATKKIKSGQMIRVHGEAGYVEILSDKGAK